MIRNIWGKVRIFCGNHGEDATIKMKGHEGAEDLDMFYSCPKYYPENREEGEHPCGNRLSISDYEQCVQHISDMLEQAEENGAVINLTGHRWADKKRTTFCVIRHTPNHIDVLVLNKQALHIR